MLHPQRPNAKAVEPLPGLAPWLGGKRQLAKLLTARIDRMPHRCYAEPFLGMGGVFLRRRRRAEAEAINDAHGEVANLFRIVQRHPEAMAEALAFAIAGRADFARMRALDPALLTDVERAARFFFLMHAGFRGRSKSPTYGASPHRRSHWDLDRLLARVRAVHRRLAGVYIEQLGYAEFIRLYDGAETLFYLDPPYWGHERDYGNGLFARADFERLAALLAGVKGRFILSINDVPEIRKLFRWARIAKAPVTYTIGGGRRVTELVISGGKSGGAA